MTEKRKTLPLPHWWQERIKESLSTFNPRLTISDEELEQEAEARIEGELAYLKPPVASNSRFPEVTERLHQQVDAQEDLLREVLKKVYLIEEYSNQIVYHLGGSLMGQVQGTHVGEVRVRLVSRVRTMQQRRAQLENEVLGMWEQIGAGSRDR